MKILLEHQMTHLVDNEETDNTVASTIIIYYRS